MAVARKLVIMVRLRSTMRPTIGGGETGSTGDGSDRAENLETDC
jgi:hypothetical protein